MCVKCHMMVKAPEPEDTVRAWLFQLMPWMLCQCHDEDDWVDAMRRYADS